MSLEAVKKFEKGDTIDLEILADKINEIVDATNVLVKLEKIFYDERRAKGSISPYDLNAVNKLLRRG